jgi:hypothetical protein
LGASEQNALAVEETGTVTRSRGKALLAAEDCDRSHIVVNENLMTHRFKIALRRAPHENPAQLLGHPLCGSA